MKKHLLILSSFATLASNAQIVGTEAFLKGNYVEIGISGQWGFEGADTPDSTFYPSGMHYRSNTSYFGFVANPQMDGWVNYDGDFYTPGSPENGWGLEILDSTFNLQINNNRAGIGVNAVHGSITSHSYVGGVTTVVWQGHLDTLIYSLDFIIKYELHDTALFYKTTTTVINVGTSTIDELYYYRNIDPDNNVTLSFDYVTTNTLVCQPYSTCGAACVKAEQSTPWASTYALLTNDSTARVSIGGFSNRDASDIWNGTGGMTGTPGYVNTSDEAISMAFKTSNLADTATAPLRAGLRSSVSFTVYSAFSLIAMNDLLSSPTLGLEEETITDFSVYPNPAHTNLTITGNKVLNGYTLLNTAGTTVMQSTSNFTNAQLDISGLNAGFYILKINVDGNVQTKKILKY